MADKAKCLGEKACGISNCAGFLICSTCGYQEDDDYIYGDENET
jgi:hypothetical protein